MYGLKEKKEIVAVAIPESEKEKLAKYAKENSSTINGVLCSLIRKFIAEKGL